MLARGVVNRCGHGLFLFVGNLCPAASPAIPDSSRNMGASQGAQDRTGRLLTGNTADAGARVGAGAGDEQSIDRGRITGESWRRPQRSESGGDRVDVRSRSLAMVVVRHSDESMAALVDQVIFS